jgi:hypothetical protein
MCISKSQDTREGGWGVRSLQKSGSPPLRRLLKKNFRCVSCRAESRHYYSTGFADHLGDSASRLRSMRRSETHFFTPPKQKKDRCLQRPRNFTKLSSQLSVSCLPLTMPDIYPFPGQRADAPHFRQCRQSILNRRSSKVSATWNWATIPAPQSSEQSSQAR